MIEDFNFLNSVLLFNETKDTVNEIFFILVFRIQGILDPPSYLHYQFNSAKIGYPVLNFSVPLCTSIG